MGPKLLVLVSTIALTLNACSPSNQSTLETQTMNQETITVKQTTPQEFEVLMQNEEAVVIDVHTPEQDHIPGTDLVIPYDQIKQSAEQLPADKEVPLLVYCRSGGMSQMATKDLVEMGYSNVYELSGGIQSWNEIYPNKEK